MRTTDWTYVRFHGPDALQTKYWGLYGARRLEPWAQRLADRVDEGHIVCLLADGGWKYLSSHLWTRDYDEIVESVSEKMWW